MQTFSLWVLERPQEAETCTIQRTRFSVAQEDRNLGKMAACLKGMPMSLQPPKKKGKTWVRREHHTSTSKVLLFWLPPRRTRSVFDTAATNLNPALPGFRLPLVVRSTIAACFCEAAAAQLRARATETAAAAAAPTPEAPSSSSTDTAEISWSVFSNLEVVPFLPPVEPGCIMV